MNDFRTLVIALTLVEDEIGSSRTATMLLDVIERHVPYSIDSECDGERDMHGMVCKLRKIEGSVLCQCGAYRSPIQFLVPCRACGKVLDPNEGE